MSNPSATLSHQQKADSSVRPAAALRSGVGAVVDQTIFSAGTFLTLVLIGRFAGDYELGVFSLAWSVVLLATAVQRALVTSAYTFQCEKLSKRRRDLRRGSAFVLAIAVTMALALIIGGVFVAMGLLGVSPMAWPGVVGAAIMAWGLRDFLRRILFADHRFAEAAALDGVVVGAQLSALGWLALVDSLSASSALLAMVLASGTITTGWIVVRHNWFRIRKTKVAQDMVPTWRFGRWAALSEGSFAGQDFAVQALLAACGGFAATGAYAACMSLVRLANPIVQAVGNAVGPLGARAFARGGIPQLTATVGRTTRMMSLMMTGYLLAMLLLGNIVLAAFYGAEHQRNDQLLMTLALATAVAAMGLAPAKAVSAVLMPRLNLIANAASLATVLAVGVLALQTQQIETVALAILAGASVGAGLKWWFYHKVTRTVVRPAEVC